MPRARSRLIASPSPVPSLVRVSPVLTCTNGSNTASCLSRGMPMPVSCTRTYATSGASARAVRATTTRPGAPSSCRAGVNLRRWPAG
jgi:hypothetical protein